MGERERSREFSCGVCVNIGELLHLLFLLPFSVYQEIPREKNVTPLWPHCTFIS